jgi:integrase
MPTGLIRRNGRYSVRRVIPKDLQAHYQRLEIVRALGTADPQEARDRHTLVWLELSREFRAVREQLRVEQKAAARAVTQPVDTPEELERKQAEHLEWQRGQWEANFYEEPEEDDPFKFRVAEAVERRLAEIAEEQAEARQIARAEKLSKETGETLFAVADKWAKEKSPSMKMVEITRKTVSDFYQIVGTIPVAAIRRSHVLTFKDNLVEKQEHPATANSRLARLRLLFGYALANGLIEANPASSVRIAKRQLAKESRMPYDADALAAVFSSPVYANDLRPKAGGGEAAYWLPLLGLYTGARLNELGQLRPCDVVEERYIGDDNQELSAWVIRIVEDEEGGLRLKTPSSRRRVPVHAELISLGFLRYVEDAKAKSRAKLFPLLKPDRFDTVTANWSKWYGRYLRKTCGVKDKRIVFHSFRHTFKDNARRCQIPDNVHNEITGHDSGNVADTYGGLSYPLHPLVEGMTLYRIPQFTPPLPPPAYRKSKP